MRLAGAYPAKILPFQVKLPVSVNAFHIFEDLSAAVLQDILAEALLPNLPEMDCAIAGHEPSVRTHLGYVAEG